MKRLVALFMLFMFILPVQVINAESNTNISSDAVLINDELYISTVDYEKVAQDALSGKIDSIPNVEISVAFDSDNLPLSVTQRILLRRRVYSNGAVRENYLLILTGSRSLTQADPSGTVKLTIGVYYEKYTGGDADSYKITQYYNIARLLDNQFRLSSTYQSATEDGRGFNANFVSIPYFHLFTYFNISHPTSGTTYSASTGFSNYVEMNNGGTCGTDCTLTFQRIPTGVYYYFSLHLNVV